MKIAKKFRRDIRCARSIWGNLNPFLVQTLLELLRKHHLSVAAGDLLLLDLRWYVTHAGLLRLAKRRRCSGIHVQPVPAFCDAAASRYAFSATVYVSAECKGFVGYGDADPSNVSPFVRGAEMRIAETRAVNRALRKAYGIGFARWRKSDPLRPKVGLSPNRRSFQPKSEMEQGTEMAMENPSTMPQSATACARSFAIISSMPRWSSPTQRTSAE